MPNATSAGLGDVAHDAPDAPKPADPAAILRNLRVETAQTLREQLATAPSPIRVMARMVNEVREKAIGLGIPGSVLAQGLVNRTIGDVNVRSISEVIDGVDYSTIGEELGIIMPGEMINGRVSQGAVYTRLRERMGELERQLLDERGIDLRIYDVYGTGNPLLRELLAARFNDECGIPARPEATFPSIGALDALDKVSRTLNMYYRQKYGARVGFAFPAPGFAVTRWQAQSLDMAVIDYQTAAEDSFKLTAASMTRLLDEHPNLRLLYLTVSNNPTAFAYSPAELQAVLGAIAANGRDMAILADLAYIGTGEPEADHARIAALLAAPTREHTIFIHSLSKTCTLTGDRMGFSTLFNDEWVRLLTATWNNATAGLPAEWQLRYMAYLELLHANPALPQKIRRLYQLRRDDLREQLHEFNRQYGLFEVIGLDDNATVYNWSKFRTGEDVFSLFEKTGVAGVDGRGFGYTDRYVRFSVGFTPVRARVAG